MHGFLRQSTASQTVVLGPFIDDTDFKSTEESLTIANTDVKLMKNGASAVNKNSGGGTHLVNGDYAITLDATDSNTVGELRISCLVSGALIVEKQLTVLEAPVYDILFADGATGDVNVGEIGGNAVSANAGLNWTTFFENSGDPTSVDVDDLSVLLANLATVDGIVDSILEDTSTDIPTTLSGLSTQSSVDDIQTTADQIISDVASVSSQVDGLNDPTAAAVADAVWEEALADHSGTSGSTAESLNAAGSAGDPWSTAVPGTYTAGQAGYILGFLNDIGAEDVWDVPTVGHGATGTFGAQASLIIDTILEYLGTYIPTPLNVDPDGNVLEPSLLSGTAEGGSTTTLIDTTQLTQADDDWWIGAVVEFTTDDLIGQQAIVTAFDSGTSTLTFFPAVTQAVATQGYELRRGGAGIANIMSRLPSSLSSGRMISSVQAMSSNVLTSTVLDATAAAEIASAVLTLTDGVESNRTVQQTLRAVLAACVGKAAGLDTNAPTYRDTNDTVNRIVAVTDAYGNRSSVTLNL